MNIVTRTQAVHFMRSLVLIVCTAVLIACSDSGTSSARRLWDRDHMISIVPAAGWVQLSLGSDYAVAIVLMGPPGRVGKPTLTIMAFHEAADIGLSDHRNADIALSRQRIPGYIAAPLKVANIDGQPAVGWIATWPAAGHILKNLELAMKQNNSIYSITYQSTLEDFDLHRNVVDNMISSIRLK